VWVTRIVLSCGIAGFDFRTRTNIVSEQANRVAVSSAGWSAKQVGDVGSVLWASFRARLSAYRRRWVAAVLYAELSKLSDVQLARRGIARGDLHRLTSDMVEG
jgi:hypothetical protein